MKRQLRVLIVGQQNSFNHILATNIRHWGHDVEVLYSTAALWENEVMGDVLIYDLDMQSGAEPRPPARLTIALSSHSISRTTLESIGAIALLQKPFEMSWLQRYLRVLHRLLFCADESQEKDICVSLAALQTQTYPLDMADGGNVRVLVVDDDVNIADMVQQYLLYESGYEVGVAHDGLEALEQCVYWEPHCIVTDLIMPWMNGYQVMRCLAASSLPTMPAFVVMSALTQFEVPTNRSYLQGKAVAYVNKPFDMDHLLTTIEHACVGAI